MIDNRFVYYIKFNKVLSDIQCFFRKYRSSTDHFDRLADDTYKDNIDPKETTAVFIDLNKVFDRINHHILVIKFQNLKYYWQHIDIYIVT